MILGIEVSPLVSIQYNELSSSRVEVKEAWNSVLFWNFDDTFTILALGVNGVEHYRVRGGYRSHPFPTRLCTTTFERIMSQQEILKTYAATLISGKQQLLLLLLLPLICDRFDDGGGSSNRLLLKISFPPLPHSHSVWQMAKLIFQY